MLAGFAIWKLVARNRQLLSEKAFSPQKQVAQTLCNTRLPVGQGRFHRGENSLPGYFHTISQPTLYNCVYRKAKYLAIQGVNQNLYDLE
jgi:hypothetical protein